MEVFPCVSPAAAGTHQTDPSVGHARARLIFFFRINRRFTKKIEMRLTEALHGSDVGHTEGPIPSEDKHISILLS